MRQTMLLALPLLLACGAPAPEGDSLSERTSLYSLDGESTHLADVQLQAWTSGRLDLGLQPVALNGETYTAKVYDFGTCAIIREKASSPVLSASGSRSVLPLTFQSQLSATEPAAVTVRQLRRELDSLDGRPLALANADGRLVACGEIRVDATASR